MTNETSDSISKPSETNVHHRRNKSDTSTSSTVPQSEEPSTKQSIIPRFASYFTFKTSAKNDTDDNKNEYTRKSTQRPWLCRNLCCKLFFLICLIYVIMYVRPDYSIHIRNSIEDILTKLNLTSSEFQYRPGQQLAKYRQPSMPIIIIPGIVSTGLELWEGTECATGRFRHRFWTSMQMVDNIGRDHQCWLKHISLDLSTWKDPESIRLRPILGWAAADYVFPGYWLWSKVIHNLADIGYDPNNLVTLGYDWRLPPQFLEERDGYFTQLKFYTEFLRQKHGEKVALLTHSMGANYVYYFLRWVTEQAGDQWIEENVATFLNVGGPLLGSPKALSAVLSGEMKDTSVLGDLGRNILGKVIGKLTVFPRFFRALGSIPSLFPRGGSDVWKECYGTEKNEFKHMLTFPKDRYKNFASRLRKLREKCEEEIDYDHGFDSILEELYAKPELVEEIMTHNHTVEQFLDVLKTIAPRYMSLVNKYYALDGTVHTKKDQYKTNKWKSDSRYWSDPLSTPLPNVTNLKIYCMYGYIQEPMTECGYSYGFYPHSDYCSSALLIFNTSHTNPSEHIKSGVYLGPGDATVPLVSLGYMCAGPWKQFGSYHNPGHVQTIIREYVHKTTTFDILTTRLEDALRGGEYAVTHVELLGNRDFLTDLLMIVSKPIIGTNQSQLLVNDKNINEDQIYSNIHQISHRIIERHKDHN
ncbi:unnamed protein product [Rotaria sp. Silwood1]|nr:unnamed protein product [Rotaria sp. Silwood1]CAF3506062.1 unnamed protein product [Rotaria sp. Silwood1]CAF3534159.1 unnamed protein product [Rotaria sp. Silwood1]CAF4558716.1 unnamed protein product [Rotaria sp. Silwood1]CAF4588055.1 unnamed protein product [Rotaria sp. Silwood1]